MKWIKISDVTKLPDEPLLLYCAEFDSIDYEDSGNLYGAHPIYTHFMLLSSFIRPNFKHPEPGHDAQIVSVDDKHMVDTMRSVYDKEQKGNRNKMKQKVKELEHNFKISSK